MDCNAAITCARYVSSVSSVGMLIVDHGGASELLRRVERAMAAVEETVGKRRATTAARQSAG